ncbi:hypothetical protein CYY_006620 [Polysphondylium violaceum]|uniref:Glutathione S-transferase n=1 Tax=Polysphondylium violaceum TaxID=133409 RepID=A0A8J4PQQ1_9MYCE|nr:hypothetical protein CYY_006620 [Polysphondylium violaceum]
MSTIPTLTYFNGQGKAESIRLILTYLNIEFNDVRVESVTPELKATLTYGQLPFYQDGDFKLAQSAAIARYIALKNDFAGKSIEEKVLADASNDSLWDVIIAIFRSRDQTDADKEKVKSVTIPTFLGAWEKNLEKNEFVAGGDSLTYADISLFAALDYLPKLGFADAIETYPKLKEFKAKIANIPSIKQYLEKRPDTKF